MAIKHWLISGDTHGAVEERLEHVKIQYPNYNPEETAIIILGDSGINFYLNKTDEKHKRNLASYGYAIYCVRGNHEERPENLPNIKLIYDSEVNNYIWIEPEHPHIRYFCDGGDYAINGYSVLTIGGSYSVDKYYRLSRRTKPDAWCGWFEGEQLTSEEMRVIGNGVRDKYFDFVLTHTCPRDWEPTDLFLSMIDQSTVDKSMENWMSQLKDEFDWGVWCFGHFHADRIEREKVQQFYYSIEPIEKVWKRWHDERTWEDEKYYLNKSPYLG